MSGTAAGPAERAADSRRPRPKLRPERLRELSLLAVIGVSVLVFSQLVDNYLSGSFFNRVTTSMAITAVLAAAQTIVILTRNIDLSVGSIVGVTAYVTGEYLAAHQTTAPVLAVGLAMLMGCVLGLLNGTLVAYGRVPAIIATLGTLAIYRTWLIGHANSRTITADSLPQWLVEFPQRTVVSLGGLDIRLVLTVAVVVIVALQLALGRLRWGRWVYAVGSNPDAARQEGLPIERITLGAFAMCGALSGLAGFMFLSRFGTITVAAGQGLELASVAAAVVGGVSIFGGSGTMIGALLGALLIDLLELSLVRVPEISVFWRDAVLGALILLAIAGDFAIRKRLRRFWTHPLGIRPSRRSGRRRRMRDRVLRWRTELLLAAILLGVVAVNASLSPYYLRTGNFVNMFQLSIEKAIVAVIMTLVIINGEIDLSVASVMGFSAAVMAALHEGGSVPFAVAVLVALLAGAGAGLLHGLFVARMGLPSLVVTIAGLIGFRGAARILVGDRSIGDFPNGSTVWARIRWSDASRSRSSSSSWGSWWPGSSSSARCSAAPST